MKKTDFLRPPLHARRRNDSPESPFDGGLSVLFAVSIIDFKKIEKLKDFKKRIEYFKNYRLKTGKYLPKRTG